ncbi:MAG: type II toxin-antitoxin system death-on-curing family toxin [Nitrososphaerota archaeon]|nr:type II toxin-antitoxin system death-on-curing family toxin [Nitrososphaerota archaeon]
MTNYLTEEILHNIHATMLRPQDARGSSRSNVLNCLERPQTVVFGHEPYGTLLAKAMALVEAICKWHPFVDGNKRTAMLALMVFLRVNDVHLAISFDVIPMLVRISQDMDDRIPMPTLVEWLERRSSRSRVFTSLLTFRYYWLTYLRLKVVYWIGHASDRVWEYYKRKTMYYFAMTEEEFELSN